MVSVLNEKDKRKIAGRAQTLFERLETPDAFVYSERDESKTEIFETWEDLFPSEATFNERLNRAELSREECKRAINVSALALDEEIPEWVHRLEELVAAVESKDPAEISPASMAPDKNDERVFGELTAALASHICDNLPNEPVHQVLSERAIDSIAEWFRRRFENRFSRILYVEFKSFIATHDRELAFADPGEFDEPPTEYYDQFIESLFSSGFADLCVEYPVFARLLTTQAQQLRDHLMEFCERLRADRERLAERFNVDGELGAVVEIEPLADDTHGDGRAVMRVRFGSGLTVAYKPRSVDSGTVFYNILEGLESQLPISDLQTPTYLSRAGYGWMEWVSYDECEDESMVERYYRRAGALICIAYFFEFSDCHVENLIVAGEHPVLVDAETIFHSYVSSDRQPERTGPSALVKQNTLLTQLVPFDIGELHTDGSGGMIEATAGLAISSDEATIDGALLPKMKAVNTDVLTVEHRPVNIDRSENIPKIEGVDQPPKEYLDTILSSFKQTYESMIELRDRGRFPDVLGFEDDLASVENRVVYRPTVKYTQVLRSLTSRDCLRDGARFSVEIEQLAVPFCTDYVNNPPWELYDAEREALRRFDPPRFTAETDSTTIHAHGRQLDVEADESGLTRFRHRLEDASHEDLHKQLEYLRGCFGVRPAPDASCGSLESGKRTPASDERFQKEAKALLDEIRDVAIETEDGTCHWASLSPWTDTDRLTIRPVGESLAVGRCGIALLGAGLYRLTGKSDYRRFALNTVQPVRGKIRAAYDPQSLTSPGGMVGLGSVAYGLAVVGDLVNADPLLDDAVEAANYFTSKLVTSDDTYDVSSGTAGTLLGFLGAAERTGVDEFVSAAECCGDHLIASRVTTENGSPAWKTIDASSPLTGFAHGTAGISYALARLSSVTGNDAYRTIALDALAFESNVFSEAHQNWPDLRKQSSKTYLDQWCYGRSGIGLARLGMAEYVSDERVEVGFSRAIEGTASATIGRMDHLCCGNTGRAEFLLVADQRRGQQQGKAREMLSDILHRKEKEGSYRTLAATQKIVNPTLFHGYAGIGYTMLRMTAPDVLPSVLLWE